LACGCQVGDRREIPGHWPGSVWRPAEQRARRG